MRKSLIALSAAAMMLATAGSGTALPINGGLKDAIDSIDLTQQAAVYVVDGRRYCFYFEGGCGGAEEVWRRAGGFE